MQSTFETQVRQVVPRAWHCGVWVSTGPLQLLTQSEGKLGSQAMRC
jgi:hypothetical protein